MKNTERFAPEQLFEILSLSENATAIYSGEDLLIQAANDAIIRIWGKDRSVIGMPLAEAVPELAGQPFIGILQEVWRTGITYEAKDSSGEFLVDGVRKLFYFDFTYRAVKDEQGKMVCILNTAIDTTERMLKNQALVLAKERTEELKREQALNEELAASNEELHVTNEELHEVQERLRKLNDELESRVQRRTVQSTEREEWIRAVIEQAPVSIITFRGAEMVVDTANPPMLAMLGMADSADRLIGRPLVEAMPELVGQPAVVLLSEVYHSGIGVARESVPVFLNRNGQLEQCYFNFNYTPLRRDGKVVGVIDIAVEVTDQVNARAAVQSLNDDLSAINEEIAASNEELAATNEELANTQMNLQDVVDRLTANEEWFRLATDAAELGTWSVDPRTMEWRTSTIFRRIHQIPDTATLKFDDAFELIDETYRSSVRKAIEDSLRKGTPYQTEYPLKVTDEGKPRWVRSVGKPNQDQYGNVISLTGVLQEITEQKQDDQRKNDFISMVSHELKTPLTSLYGYIQMLQVRAKDSNDVFGPAALNKAASQVKKMTSMVNGFLNVSRLESGKILITKSIFNLDALIHELIEDSMITQSTHRVTLSPCAPIEVNADQDKISIVISNLLSNAIKYSPQAKEVAVTCQVKDGRVEVSVKDKGIGIRSSDLDKLFERYFRVENHNISGFGIGLYLSSEIIRRHDGRIWAESEEGKGSTFYFSLPI